MEQCLTLLEEGPSKDLDSSIISETICNLYKKLERESHVWSFFSLTCKLFNGLFARERCLCWTLMFKWCMWQWILTLIIFSLHLLLQYHLCSGFGLDHLDKLQQECEHHRAICHQKNRLASHSNYVEYRKLQWHCRHYKLLSPVSFQCLWTFPSIDQRQFRQLL